MGEGKDVLVTSLSVFAVFVVVSLAFGFFVYPNLDIHESGDSTPESDVLGALEQANHFAYECPEGFPVVNVPSDFSSIQGAIDSVQGGAIINVASGLYAESVVLKPQICLIGEELGEVEIQGFSDTVIKTANQNKIQNFKVSSLGNADVGILVSGAQEVNITENTFQNFKTAIVVEKLSTVSIRSSGFWDVQKAMSFTDSQFFLEESHIQFSDVAVESFSSRGDVVGMVFEGGEYGLKADDSNLFFNKNNFRSQSVAGMELCSLGDYDLGSNFFDNIDEEVVYN